MTPELFADTFPLIVAVVGVLMMLDIWKHSNKD